MLDALSGQDQAKVRGWVEERGWTLTYKQGVKGKPRKEPDGSGGAAVAAGPASAARHGPDPEQVAFAVRGRLQRLTELLAQHAKDGDLLAVRRSTGPLDDRQATVLREAYDELDERAEAAVRDVGRLLFTPPSPGG